MKSKPFYFVALALSGILLAAGLFFAWISSRADSPEAMAARVPAVVANTSSLPEVAAGHAILVEPDGASIAAGLLDATSGDAALAAMLRAARTHAREFTWERSAREHARIWASVL